MPASIPRRTLQQPVRLERGPAHPVRRGAAAKAHARGAARVGVWPLALVMMTYVLANELVHDPRVVNETFQKIWSGGRYIAALGVAPALLIARGPRPLARCWPVLPFAIFAAASITWSAFPKDSMRLGLNLFALIVINSTLVSWCGLVDFGRRVQIVTGLLMMASLLMALLVPSLGVHHAYDVVEPHHLGNWRGLFVHKNVLGGMAVTSIIFGLRSIRHETGAWKAFFILARVCSVVCLVKASSAGAFAGALVALTFFLLMKNRVTAHPLSIVGVALIGAVLVPALSLSAGRLAEFLGRDSTFTGRTGLWTLGWSMIQSHLLFGFGLGADSATFGALAKRQFSVAGANLHSGYLDVLFNLGVLGAALLMLAIGAALVRGYAYTQTHSGDERDQAVIFMTLVVTACAIATVEIYPITEYGSVALWTALPALYQLGSWRGRRRVAQGGERPNDSAGDGGRRRRQAPSPSAASQRQPARPFSLG